MLSVNVENRPHRCNTSAEGPNCLYTMCFASREIAATSPSSVAMDIAVTPETLVEPGREPLRLRHAMMVFTSPRTLFARVEDTGTYGLALATLLSLVLLVGYAQIKTGLVDRVVDQQTEAQLAALEETQGQLVDRLELRDRMETIRKQGVFNKEITRLQAIVAMPVYFLASFMLIASVLYAAVALTGRKPEYHTLLAICVYAGFIELAAYALQLGMMLYYRTLAVDTSLGMLVPPGEPSWLSAIDPFRFWFWVLVAIGVAVTHQLGRRMAIASCVLMCLVATGVRVALSMIGGG